MRKHVGKLYKDFKGKYIKITGIKGSQANSKYFEYREDFHGIMRKSSG